MQFIKILYYQEVVLLFKIIGKGKKNMALNQKENDFITPSNC